MGWSYEELYITPVVYFFAAMKAFLQDKESRQKQLFEIVRMHSTTILNSFSKHRIRPQDVMRFPWDEGQKISTIEEVRANPILQKWAANPPKRSFHPLN